MPVKHFILLVVYLLVSLASSFSKEGICQRTVSVMPLTFIEWRPSLRKEEKQQLWKQISWCKSETFKVTITFSVYMCIFSYVQEKKLKVKSKFVKFIKCIAIVK